jgi:hypothetical protein
VGKAGIETAFSSGAPLIVSKSSLKTWFALGD